MLYSFLQLIQFFHACDFLHVHAADALFSTAEVVLFLILIFLFHIFSSHLFLFSLVSLISFLRSLAVSISKLQILSTNLIEFMAGTKFPGTILRNRQK